MKIIAGKDIGSTLKELRPTHIAVAYLGADWREYLGNILPEEVIVSPTLGTNPYALAEIGEVLGWQNVHLLKSLHAKIYLGSTEAIIGSCNLTKNGLRGDLLHEVAVLLTEKEAIAELRDEYHSLKDAAQDEFPTAAEKQSAIHSLERLWNKACTEGVIVADKPKNKLTIADYTDGNDSFYVAWWGGDEIRYNDCALDEAFSDELPSGSEKPIENALPFLDSDHIEEHKWILCWQATTKGKFYGRSQPYWLYVHKIVRNGAVDEPYTQLAICRSDENILPAPFYLGDNKVKSALRTVLDSGRHKEFSRSGDDPWSIMPTLDKFREFIFDVKRLATTPSQDGKT